MIDRPKPVFSTTSVGLLNSLSHLAVVLGVLNHVYVYQIILGDPNPSPSSNTSPRLNPNPTTPTQHPNPP